MLLLQKAFAKSVGCYGALEQGIASEALMDLTGCPTSRLIFGTDAVKAAAASGALFDTLCTWDQQR